MKRILLSVFAAAITAAWVVPAGAADVTFSGEYRLRGEYSNNSDFRKDVNDHTDSWGQRVRLTANAKATDDTSVKITVQDTRNWGAAQAAAGGPNLTDDGVSNQLDLHESYVNVENLFGAPVSLRAGRQELNYGDQRLVGSFGWNNNGRSFDALKVTYKSEQVDVDLFESKITENTITSTDQDFFGAYATVKAIPDNTLDLYVLALRNGNNTALGFSSTTLGNTTISGNGNPQEAQKLYTYGARLKGIKLGYALPTPMKVRVGAEYDFASGDKDNSAADNKIKTFFNLFPTNHGKFGIADQQGWRNTKTWNINAKADVNEKLSVSAAYFNIRLAEKTDAWYGAGNWNTTPTGIRAANANNTQNSVGSEFDIVANYKYNSAVSAQLGLSRFTAGSFIKDQINATAGAEKGDKDFAYLMLTANF